MKTVNLLDLDDTLCYPSPYRQLRGDISKQHFQARTKEFQEQLLDCPRASWLWDKRYLLKADKTFIITGRHPYQAWVTREWLKKNKIRYNRIIYLKFDGNYEKYVAKKIKAFFSLISKLEKIGFDYFRIIDDSKQILERASKVLAKHKEKGSIKAKISFFLVEKGEIHVMKTI